MTPKEKAIELCQQFALTTRFADDCNDGKTLPLRIAKICAVIAVQEILDALNFAVDHKYWADVLTEIEKI